MWEKVKLGDVCTIFGGYAFKSEQYIKNAVPLVRISNITENQIILDDECSIEENSKYNQFEILNGDILIALSGATTGKFGVFNSNNKAYVNQRVALIRKTDQTCQKFIFYYLNQIKEDILRKAGGAAQPNISTTELGKFEIPLPPLPVQEKIAAILDKADELRRKDKALQDKYDNLAQAIFIDMFGDPVRNEKGWERATLQKFYKNGVKCGPFGSALKKEEFLQNGIPVWNMDNIQSFDFVDSPNLFVSKEKYSALKQYEVINGDIIISRAGTVGKMCVVDSKFEKSLLSTNLIKLSLDEVKLQPLFFVYLMKFFTKRLGRLKTGSEEGFTHMNTGVLDNLEIYAPPLHLQEEFAKKIELINQLKAQTNAEKSEELFQSLLQQAFKGELVS